MLAAKICSITAVIHIFCGALMIFTDPSYRWRARDLTQAPRDPSHIALGAVGINARLQLQNQAVTLKLRAADRQVAAGFALVAFIAQDLAVTLKKGSSKSPTEASRLATTLLLWHGMLFRNYVEPMALLSSWELPTLSVQELFFALVASMSIAASLLYLLSLLLWLSFQRWLDKYWRRRHGEQHPNVMTQQAFQVTPLTPTAPPM